MLQHFDSLKQAHFSFPKVVKEIYTQIYMYVCFMNQNRQHSSELYSSEKLLEGFAAGPVAGRPISEDSSADRADGLAALSLPS